MEIRRFKLVANASSGFIDVESSSSNKRLKLANGSGIAGHDIARDCPSAVKKSSSSSSSSSEELQETDGLSSGGEKALASLPSLYLLSADASLDDDDQCPPHGVVSVCGRRREMEDALAVMPSFIQCHHAHGVDASRVYHFFGVYDGHGGSQAAVYCKERLHQALAEEIVTKEPKTEVEWQIVMSNCFMRMDTEVAGLCSKKQGKSGQKIESQGGAPDTVGSTAVVAVVGSKQIIVGNCGDSRAVLSSGGKAIALSADHKPDRADEMVRIEAAGGRVIYWNGYRVLGVLAMSRAIGDRYLKPYVIAEPELTITERRDEDECLILASDGLWDVLSNEVVCEVARKCLGFGRTRNSEEMASCSAADPEIESPTATAAALLTKLALARGSTDNISVVVIDLKKNPLQISKAKL